MGKVQVRAESRGAGPRVRAMIRRRWAAAGESGQALALVLIAVLLIAVLVPIVGENVVTESAQVNRAELSDMALAAAQAGANDYRTYIDNNSQYEAKVCGTSGSNLALGGGSTDGYACNTWEPVSGTTNEWFHYVPDASQLKASTGGSQGQLLLEVTGRAGYPGDYQYRSILVGYTLSGILTDSYYSEYELTDPQEPGVYTDTATVKTPSGATTTESLSQITVAYSETTGGTTNYYGPESLLDALCVYHTYSENTFIDALGTVKNHWVNGGTQTASPTNPYYGPFYDSAGTTGSITYNVPASLPNGNIPPNASDTITIGGGPCYGAYGQGIYDGSVVFNGIAYTNDQLAFCDSGPTFNEALESGAPSAIPYGDDWPGSVAKVVGGKTEYFPRGYTYSFADGCSDPAPNFGASANPKTPVLNQDQHLPPTVAGFEPFADGGEVSVGLPAGCLFTGPTIIEFVKGGTMNVWSPLSQNTNPDNPGGASAADCGTYSPGQPYQTGIPVPTGGVIYVEGEQGSGPNSGYNGANAPGIISTPCSSYTSAMASGNNVDINVCVPNSSGSGYVSEGQVLQGAITATSSDASIPVTTCIDPYFYNTLNSSGTLAAPAPPNGCEEGDAIVEGELRGALTVAADNNIIVSRDLTYQCADGSGGATEQNPALVVACNTAGTNDVLALVPQQQLIISGPTNQPFNSNCGKGSSPGCGTEAAPTCSNDGTTVSASPINDAVPWSCDINTTFADGNNGVVIDAAAVDLTGSTYAQNFNILSLHNANMYQDGTNINYFPGFNGSTSGAGYNQIITYDQRLAYENPPGLLQATDTVWNMSSFILCGTVNSANFPVTDPGTTSAFQQLSCPSLS